jgi:hypothetical protein
MIKNIFCCPCLLIISIVKMIILCLHFDTLMTNIHKRNMLWNVYSYSCLFFLTEFYLFLVFCALNTAVTLLVNNYILSAHQAGLNNNKVSLFVFLTNEIKQVIKLFVIPVFYVIFRCNVYICYTAVSYSYKICKSLVS